MNPDIALVRTGGAEARDLPRAEKAGSQALGLQTLTSRRRILHAAAASGTAGALLLAGCSTAPVGRGRAIGADPFTLGVASGYPTPEGIVLWTRLAPALQHADVVMTAASVSVSWEMASDEAMRNVIASGNVDAVAASAHSVHVEVAGLSPARWYWYRFSALGHRSRTGRTRTLPHAQAALPRLRLGIASCQNQEHGFYAAYRHLAADEPDLIVHVGDYIYEGSWGDLFRPLKLPEAQTLAQYRERHAICKRDPDLQNAHAMFPWMVVWDDHEVSNDYADASPERITAPEDFLARRADAYRAYYEHMPMPRRMAPAGSAMRIHTSVRIGELATLYLLDQRQYRSPQACPRPGRAGGTAVIAAECAALQDPARTLLGRAQEQWLDQQFAGSSTRWNLVAQQTLMAPLMLPRSANGPARVRTDGWDGYPVSRRRLLDSMNARRLRNPVVVGGDLHAFYAADLHRGQEAASAVIATEFVGTSITSQAADQGHYDRLRSANPHIHYANGTQRGYLRLTLTRERLQADLMGLDDVRRPDSGIARQAAFVVEAGRPGPQRG